MLKSENMMSTINDFFIDSSILIEYNKGNKRKLFTELLGNDVFKCFVNEVVLSEFLYHFLAHNATSSPLALKEAGKISDAFANSDQYKLINMCHFLPNDRQLFSMVPGLMAKYNLLSNDAIILATCKLHNISTLVSHDTDFIAACKGEGITLLTEG